MPIKLPDESRRHLLGSIQRFYTETMDEEIGDLKATMLLDFFIAELGPPVYNRAVAEAQARLIEVVGELDATCYEPEFTYWQRKSRDRKR